MKPFSEYLSREERRSCLRDEQWRIERDRRHTREEQKMRRLTFLSTLILVLMTLVVAATTFCVTAKSTDVGTVTEPAVVATAVLPEEPIVVELEGVDVVAQEPVTYEDWFRENATVVEDCKLTHYCTELRPHICGTGDGVTSTGVPVTAYWTCAVDPDVIPYGATVMVDYGDRVEYRKAQDCGPWVKGNHLDLAVMAHDEAEDLGIKYATVYWLMEEAVYGE